MTDEPETREAGSRQDRTESADAGETALNSQIVDAVGLLNAVAAGEAPAVAAAMLSLAEGQASALGLYNAVARQQADATIGSAAVAAVCARLIGSCPPLALAGAVPPALVDAVEAQARAAILILQDRARGGDDAAAAALERLTVAASQAGTDTPAPARSRSKGAARSSKDGRRVRARAAR